VSGLLDAALELALQFGWPVMWVKPHAKEPQTPHGVKDATTDEQTIRAWAHRWPDGNLAVATGAPGPSVLDVDDPDQAQTVAPKLAALHAPTSMTVRGPHLFFAGLQQATIVLPYGELRGRGSYVLVPPSIHPTGKQYVWLDAPRPGQLPAVPAFIAADRQPAGHGDFHAPPLIPHGKRHEALKDAAVRLLRAGFTDVPTLEMMLRNFYETRCVQIPKARRDEFRKLADWATRTQIAGRERLTDDNAPMPAKRPKAKRKAKTALEDPPSGAAPLAEHRAYVKLAAGLPDAVDARTVIRHGARGVDALIIELTNGQRITFDRQDHVTTRGWWARIVITCTNGIADPLTLTEREATKVFRSLCILADAPLEQREAEELRDSVEDLLALAEPLTGYDLGDPKDRFDVTARCRARPPWDPRRDEHQPVVIVDLDGRRYLRAGELLAHLSHRGLTVGGGALPGRMHMLGAERLHITGREGAQLDGRARRTAHMQLYRLPEQW
jgi:hypothetical protein